MPVTGRRHAPGRRRSHPRRRDRVRPLPLPRRRRTHPPLDPQLFYKHRGLERAADGRTLDASARLRPARLRSLRGRQHRRLRAGVRGRARPRARPRAARRPHRAARARARLQPPARHLRDLRRRRVRARHDGLRSAQGTRPAPQPARSSATASCSTPCASAAGDVALDAARHRPRLRGALRECAPSTAAAWRQLSSPLRCRTRLAGVGVLTREDAERLGAVGPAARAAGVRRDVRRESPRLSYDGFTPASRPAAASRGRRQPHDSARDRARAVTSRCSTGYWRSRSRPASTTTVADATGVRHRATSKSPRGAHRMRSSSPTAAARAMHLRTGSYANWPALAHAAAGNLLPDFPLINKSFELCYACVDR